jgi:nucleotide-binding universal stress UspA family protein
MSSIIVGVDGSKESAAALEWATEEARLRGACLDVVYVYEHTPSWQLYRYPTGMPVSSAEEQEQERRQAAQRAYQLAEGMIGPRPDTPEIRAVAIEDRRPARALIERSRDAQLLVVGSRGRGGFTGLLLGSVSQQCAAHAHCPVVIVSSTPRGADHG